MKLPRAEAAVIESAKLRDYCLNPDHPRGKHKARVFESALNLISSDSEELRRAIESQIVVLDCEEREVDRYGARYVVDFEMKRAGKRPAFVRRGSSRQTKSCPV